MEPNNNTPTAAFAAWFATCNHHGLPWQTDPKELEEAYKAGYNAGYRVGGKALDGPSKADSVAFTGICAMDVYNAYPRKVGKAAALKAIEKASRLADVSYEHLLERARAYRDATATWPKEDRQYIPHPATWFTRASYDDDPAEWQRGGAATVSQFRTTH